MPISVTRGKCSAQFKAPDSAAGKRAKCSKCGSASTAIVAHRVLPPSVAVPVPKGTVVNDFAPAAKAPTQRPPSIPQPQSALKTKTCPFCAEEVAFAAVKCKHCGETIDPVLRAAEESRRHAVHSSHVAAPAIVNVTQSVAQVVNRKHTQGNGFVAAFLSFLVPGLGQLYRGRFISAVCWFVLTIFGYAFFIVPGLMLHIVCIISAAMG